MNNHIDTSSNEIWECAENFDDFETSRPLLFRDDMRDQFFKWFHIKPSDTVLDGGCATGVLTRFIAKGLDTGSITGFDISQNFVDYGNRKIQEEGLSDRAKIVKEDGFNLSFADNTFDAVVNHTYLGVLSDVMAGLKEMIRVCKFGGYVSASCSSRGFPGVHWVGDNPFAGETRLNELKDKYGKAFNKMNTKQTLKQDEYWDVMRYPRLFSICGLTNITIHPYASGFSYNDSYWTDEFKEYIIKSNIKGEIESNRNSLEFTEYGFSSQDYDEMVSLLQQKQEYLLFNMNNTDCWEWDARMHLIVTGMKV